MLRNYALGHICTRLHTTRKREGASKKHAEMKSVLSRTLCDVCWTHERTMRAANKVHTKASRTKGR